MKSITTPNLYYVETLDAFEQLLERPVLDKEHIYCGFQKKCLHPYHLVKLKDRHIKSISFADAYTIYPTS